MMPLDIARQVINHPWSTKREVRKAASAILADRDRVSAELQRLTEHGRLTAGSPSCGYARTVAPALIAGPDWDALVEQVAADGEASRAIRCTLLLAPATRDRTLTEA